MIKFDPSKIEFKKAKLKTLNPMSGSFFILDETSIKEKTIKVECSNTITRFFKKIHNSTNFPVPQECCITYYDGHVIALEKAPINERTFIGLNGEIKEWTTKSETHFDKVLKLLDNNDWYIDGSYLYSFGPSIENAVYTSKSLSDDNRFRAISTKSIFLNYIGFNDDIYIENRNCLCYFSKNTYSITPPIWKTLDSIGNNTMKKADSDVIKLSSQFDKVDVNMAVNLQFAISCGKSLTSQFGYQIIEPLQLPKLMIQLNTVNLQSIAPEIRNTYDIGLTFKHAMAWLLGINMKITTYDEMLTMRSTFRYLTTNGVFNKSSVKEASVDTNVMVPLMHYEPMHN